MSHRFSLQRIRYVLGPALAIAVPMSVIAAPAESAGAVSGHHHVQRGWMDRNANPAHPWMYVASGQTNVVTIYELKRLGPRRIGQITDGLLDASGLALDGQGTLYVANWNLGNPGGSVTIYPVGATRPSLTLTQGLSIPMDVAVDANGDVFVLNRGSNPSIVVYPPGQTTPSETITSDLIRIPTQGVFDPSGDFFFGDNVTGVSELPYGSQQPVSLGLQGLNVTSGVALDPVTGNLFVSTVHDDYRVYVYAPGSRQPTYALENTVGACTLASGQTGAHLDIFVPSCGSDGTVQVFKSTSKKLRTAWAFSQDEDGATALAFKPAGMP
jgi:DNA-binding beta-propeller fold protein YncE